MSGGMAPRVLFVNNATRRGMRPEVLDAMAGDDLAIETCWAHGGEFPPDGEDYAGVYLSGSPHGSYERLAWIEREHRFIEELANRGVPMFGVCFGSQILASALCGRDQVFRREFCEIGYKDLPVMEAASDDPIAGALGKSVHMFVWHNDEVRGDHPDMTVLASSDLCPNQIWRWRDAPVWGIQGHPEITREQAPIWFEENRDRMEKDGANVEALKASADEAVEAKTMLTRFVDLVKARAWPHR